MGCDRLSLPLLSPRSTGKEEKWVSTNQKGERPLTALISASDWSEAHRIRNRALIGPVNDSVAGERAYSSQWRSWFLEWFAHELPHLLLLQAHRRSFRFCSLRNRRLCPISISIILYYESTFIFFSKVLSKVPSKVSIISYSILYHTKVYFNTNNIAKIEVSLSTIYIW